jgi:DNA repair photolyase
MQSIGITERGDPAFSTSWKSWAFEGNPTILITKNPTEILNDLKTLGKEANVIVHCGITGLGGTRVEPNVPSVGESLGGYRGLIAMLGRDRVVLRLDPVFPTEKGFKRTLKVVEQHEGTRIRLAFLQAYPHVKKRFQEAGLTPPPYPFYAPLETRKRIHRQLESIACKEIEVCGEPGFQCTGCISPKDCKILGVAASTSKSQQRKHCACLGQKRELLNDRKQCLHNCLYCFWRST